VSMMNVVMVNTFHRGALPGDSSRRASDPALTAVNFARTGFAAA
jgi:hypothetical protein